MGFLSTFTLAAKTAWNFYIGGYQKIIVALTETARLMGEIYGCIEGASNA